MSEAEVQEFFKEQIQKTKEGNMKIYKRALKNLDKLKALQKALHQGGSTSSRGLYKYFNQSFKVFQLQPEIKKIHDLLKIIVGEELNAVYNDLVQEALNKKFISGGKAYSYGEEGFDDGVAAVQNGETNNNWLIYTSSIVLTYMVSERILDKLIWICENKPDIIAEDLGEYAFTELNVIFKTC